MDKSANFSLNFKEIFQNIKIISKLMDRKDNKQKTLAIIVTCGVTPGTNDLISSITIFALDNKWKVIGIHDGFQHLICDDHNALLKNVVTFDHEIAMGIKCTGGCFLRTTRVGNFQDEKQVDQICAHLKKLKVDYVCIVTGIEKLALCHKIAEKFKRQEVQVLAVGKSIDNDLPLPEIIHTFGYLTAKIVGTELLGNLRRETNSYQRYFVIEVPGKKSGHLALGMASGSSSCLSIMPEDWQDFAEKKINIDTLLDYAWGCVMKRYSLSNKKIGTIILCEGIVNYLDDDSLKRIFNGGKVPRNEDGSIILDEAELSVFFAHELRKKFSALKNPPTSISFMSAKIGYILRGSRPCATDIQIATELGVGTVEGFADFMNDSLVVFYEGRFSYRPLAEMVDNEGHITSRLVDTTSEEYRIIKKYQAFITESDLENKEIVEQIAKLCEMSPEQFVARFKPIVNSYSLPNHGPAIKSTKNNANQATQ